MAQVGLPGYTTAIQKEPKIAIRAVRATDETERKFSNEVLGLILKDLFVFNNCYLWPNP
jgi:hypothetical protein